MARLGVGQIIEKLKSKRMEIAFGFDEKYYARIMVLNEALNVYELKEFLSATKFEYLNTKIKKWYRSTYG